jgi:hypothetical protein
MFEVSCFRFCPQTLEQQRDRAARRARRDDDAVIPTAGKIGEGRPESAQSISLARARIACGTAKVIALVFFRLIANSNLVGYLTGIFVVRVPRMMRSIMRTAARIESVSHGPMRRGHLPLRSLRLRYRRQPRAVQAGQ